MAFAQPLDVPDVLAQVRNDPKAAGRAALGDRRYDSYQRALLYERSLLNGAHLLLRKTEIGSPATVPAQDAVALMRCQSMWPAGSFSTHYF
jgi:hypothetical protein